MARTSDAKVTRPVAQLANLDLNLLVILRELIRERNVTRAAQRVFAAETEFDPRTSNREFTLLMADYTLAVIGDRLSAFVEREAPDVRLHILLVRGPLAAEAEEQIRRIDGIVSPPLTALMVPRVHSAELFRDRWACVCWKGNTALNGGTPSVAEVARMNWMAPFVPDRGRTPWAPLDLRIMPCPGASEAIVEALWWCEDYDDDPAHRWLRQNLQMLAAEV